MFICEQCGRQTEPREKMHKLIVEKREKVYPDGSTGWEIARELSICHNCAEQVLYLGEK